MQSRRPAADVVPVVAVCIGMEGPFDLVREVAVVKAALLYGDRVTLVSNQASVMSAYENGIKGSESERLAFAARQLDRHPHRPGVLSLYRDVLPPGDLIYPTFLGTRNVAILSRQGFELKDRLEDALRPVADAGLGNMSNALSSVGRGELDLAEQEGLLSIDPLGLDDMFAEGPEMARVSFANLDLALKNAVSGQSSAVPMLEGWAWLYLTMMVNEGRIARPTHSPLTDTALAASLVSDLPAMVDAPMEDVLEVRILLGDELAAFRSAVSLAAREIETLPPDGRFAAEVERVYERLVKPAKEDLAKQLTGGSRSSQLGRVLKRSGLVMGAVGIAGNALGMGEVALLAGSAMWVAGVGDELLADIASRRSERRAGFIFLFDLQRELEARGVKRRSRRG
jgi:hypothetical protein